MAVLHEWRDTERIPRGMSDFKRWYHGTKGIADVDGIIHSKKDNRFMMLEFKPYAKDLSEGQKITLKGFSKLPNCTAVAVFDPLWNDTSREAYDQDLRLKVLKFKNGIETLERMTVAEFNIQIDKWFQSTL